MNVLIEPAGAAASYWRGLQYTTYQSVINDQLSGGPTLPRWYQQYGGNSPLPAHEKNHFLTSPAHFSRILRCDIIWVEVTGLPD